MADGEARVARSVAVMQAMLDSLHADVEVRVSAIEALAARAAASMPAGGPAPGTQSVQSSHGLWGVRGPERPGSVTNPIVMVMEAAKYTPMGSFAAAMGESNVQDVQRGDQASGVASAADLAALTAAVHELAQNVNPAQQLAQAGNAGMGEPGAAERTVFALDDADRNALHSMAAAMNRMDQRATQGGHTIIVDHAGAPRGPADRVIIAGGTGSDAGRTVISGRPGDNTVRLDGGQYAGLISAILDANHSLVPVLVGGGGGGGAPPVAVGGGNNGGGFPLAALLLGRGGGFRIPFTGIGVGAAGFGSLGAFAGLGAEHIITTALGIAGSAGAALGGAGLLGLGAAGTIGVGAGSDLGILKSTIGDTQTLSKAYDNLQKAIFVYGKGSQQATVAQKEFNYQVQQFGGPNAIGVKAELQLRKAANALDQFFDVKSQAARVQAVNIIMQAIKTGYTFIPLITEAARRNLSIINDSLKPLFAWLQGPQGIQIFNDLENKFASNLPTAMHAFTQGVELLLRVVDIASQYTGGFVHWLDRLFTRLNSMDNVQIGQFVGRLIDDFRLWEHFVKLLIEDIFLLFHQDVGTGNAIIGALTGMLQKFHDWETSTRGSAQIMSIFMIHKTEILEILSLLPKLASTFGHVYLALAPPLVSVLNTVVLPVLNELAKVMAFIAKQSPIFADVIGGLLIASKAFGTGAVVSGLGRLIGIGGAARVAAGAGAGGAAVEGAGAAAGVGILSRASGLIAGGGLSAGAGLAGLGFEGAGMGLATAAATVAPFVLPAVLGAVGAYFGVQLLSGGGGPARTVTPTSIQAPTPAARAGVTGTGAARGGVLEPLSAGSGILNIREVGRFANYSADQLRELIKVMQKANGLQLNGVNVPKEQLIKLAEAALKLKDQWNRTFNEAWTAVNTFYRNTSRTLPALKDDFDSNMRLIAHTMGLNSNEGQKLVADNVRKMVDALNKGMLDGKIGVQQGMREMNRVLNARMQDTADISKTSWQSIFNNLKQQYDDGLITHKQFLDKLHAAQQNANAQQSVDMAAWVGQLSDAMKQSGALTAQGMQIITKEVNQALGLFGANKLPVPSAIQWLNFEQQGASHTSSSGIGHRARGGFVDKPMVMVGEEAPAHNEYVIAVNPAYRQRNLGLWMQAGHELGIPGFAQGGRLSYGQLEGLWDAAGGPHNVASVAAAIALAESGGADVMQQGQPFATTGWGYWQITPGGPQYLDPMVNARAAVAKYRAAGGFSPWTTFNDGAYRAFLRGGVPPSVAAAMAAIATPHVKGGGGMGRLLNAALGKTAHAANAFLSRSSAPAGGGGPAVSGRGGFSASQLGTFDGFQVADWIIRELDYARAHGWTGHITSGYRPGFDPHTVNGFSEHSLDIYPGGAVDFGGMIDPAGAANRAAFMAAVAGYPSSQKLIPPVGFRDDGHMSGTGHFMGGIIPGYATGGVLGFTGGSGTTGAARFGTPSFAAINATARGLNSVLGTDGQVAKLGDLLSFWQGIWGLNSTVSGIMSGGPSAAIITDPVTGTQSIDQASVNLAIAHLTQEVGWEGQIVGDLSGALSASKALIPKIKQRINDSRGEIRKRQQKIRENLQKIKQYQGMITAERKKKNPNRSAIKGWQQQITSLQAENRALGGAAMAVGTGGEIGQYASQITSLQGTLQTVAGYPDTIGGAGGTGLGGELGPARIALAQYEQQLGALSPGALSAALATATAGSGSADQSELLSLTQQLLQQSNEALYVSQQQYGVLANLPPFGGSFAAGGIVPGPPGAARTIIAHGGEEYLGVGGRRTPELHIHGLGDFVDRVEQVVDGKKQEISNYVNHDLASGARARRLLPGRTSPLVTR